MANTKSIKNNNDITLDELARKLYSINAAETNFQNAYADATIGDLNEVGALLVKVQRQLNDYHKRHGRMKAIKGMFSRIPFVGKIADDVGKEIALQQNITEYVTETLEIFGEKYDELVGYLEVFEDAKKSFKKDIKDINEWIELAEQYKSKLESTVDIVKMDRLLTEAKSELKRKLDTIDGLITPITIAAQNLTKNINELTPVLKNILHCELKTMRGINSFKEASDMLVTLKDAIVEIQKMNIINANDTILSILDSTKTNLLTQADMEEMDALREEGRIKTIQKVGEIQKLQAEYQKYINHKYNEIISDGTLAALENKDDMERLIEVSPIEENKPKKASAVSNEVKLKKKNEAK